MPSPNKSKPAAATGIAKVGRYVKRATAEPGVRDQAKIAFESIESAYRRLERGKSPTAAVLKDKKLHRDLRRALRAIQDGAGALAAPPKMRTRDAIALGGALSALLIVAGIAFARNEKLRSKVLGKRSGTGDESEIQEPAVTMPAPAPPTPANPS